MGASSVDITSQVVSAMLHVLADSAHIDDGGGAQQWDGEPQTPAADKHRKELIETAEALLDESMPSDNVVNHFSCQPEVYIKKTHNIFLYSFSLPLSLTSFSSSILPMLPFRFLLFLFFSS